MGGFVMLSSYLLEHPLLSPTDVRVLSLIVRHARDMHTMREGAAVASRASREQLLATAGVSHPSMKRSLDRLEHLGLLRVEKHQKRHVYVLLPGPWPMLGDRPEKGLTWGELRTYNDPATDAGVWEEVSREGVTMEVIMSFMDQSRKRQLRDEQPKPGSLDRPKSNKATRRPAREVPHDDPPATVSVSDSTFDVNPDSERFFHCAAPVIVKDFFTISPQIVKDSFTEGVPTAYTLTTLSERFFHYLSPKTRVNDVPDDVSAIGTPIYSIKGFTPTQMKNRRCATTPGGVSRHTRVATSRTQPADPQREIHGAIKTSGGQGRLGAREKNHKPKVNHKGAAMTRYRTLIDERYGIDLAKFTAGQQKQFQQTVDRYGPERTLALITWVFDNWEAIKRQNPRLFGSDRIPPLKSFTAANIADGFLPYVDAGDPFDTADSVKNPWQHVAFGAGREEDEIDLSDELRKLL